MQKKTELARGFTGRYAEYVTPNTMDILYKSKIYRYIVDYNNLITILERNHVTTKSIQKILMEVEDVNRYHGNARIMKDSFYKRYYSYIYTDIFEAYIQPGEISIYNASHPDSIEYINHDTAKMFSGNVKLIEMVNKIIQQRIELADECFCDSNREELD